MLDTLSIRQFAIIEHSEIHFKSGFNVLSGETGAGKSILIDAISLLLGHRADAGMIRHGADKADIHAAFSQIPENLATHLADNELADADEPHTALIRRTIREKASKSFINAQPVTAALLKQLSEQLVNIHGQHANQALLHQAEQRRRLDRFGKLDLLVETVQQRYQEWKQQEAAWQAWQQARDSLNERLELCAYQLQEFEQAAPQDNEFSELAEQHALLASADEILSKGGQLSDALYENEHSAAALLRQLAQQAEQLAALHGNFQESAELLNQAAIYADEAADALARQLGKIEHDPEQLAQLDERMSALHSLARKHRIEPEQLGSRWQQLAEEHQRLSAESEGGENSSAALQAAEKAYRQAAENLSQARHKAAQNMAAQTLEWIRQLGMEKAQFSVHISPSEKPSAYGIDDIHFLLCANPGQQLQSLAKVASGGELSRISLAIEVACLDDNAVPHTLIFDEIDAGIGGEVADTVGRLLAKLSQTRQVLCITHLPQVAAYAAHHFRIEKTSDEHSTQTRVIPLDKAARIIELARMLGSADSETSRKHAETMLKNSRTI